LAIGEVTDKNYLKEPGIHRTLLGNGAANIIAALVGGPPVRIYAEITGAVAVFRRWRPALMVWAALFAMALSFLGKLSALLRSIPDPVSGGILILFFGILVVVGIKCLLKVQSELMVFRNILVVLLILVTGIGGITFSAGTFTLKGVSLATLTGVILNLVLPDKKATEEG
jgi:uracil permease